ncbi:MAG: WXG100 family type VII secretion target [Mycobacteriaceae bacterium]
MSDYFHIDPSGLNDAVALMESFDHRVTELLHRIDATIAELHISWEGEAATAHNHAHQRWVRGAQDMREALTQLRDTGTGAHHNYTSSSVVNTRMWP